MKTLFSIILIAVSTNVYSQVTVQGGTYNKGETIKNESIDKYRGSYSWKSGNNSFRLILEKKTTDALADHKMEVITGLYSYYKDNKAVYVYTQNPPKSGNLIGSQIVNGKLKIYFEDGKTKVRAHGFLSFNQKNELIWNISRTELEGPRLNNDKKENLTVPLDMVLTRIN